MRDFNIALQMLADLDEVMARRTHNPAVLALATSSWRTHDAAIVVSSDSWMMPTLLWT